ncbi:hypothetical protein NQ176_g352 [Zarea fungicola]|uniref:Uncharacterized protein n=1 Tax=Zarea fungicola TaxID=93591 RepID=A0ACC1NXB5_9HYPO|nr:hypothetical protein NQ176_g352 [Lecanicillium fungicola]
MPAGTVQTTTKPVGARISVASLLNTDTGIQTHNAKKMFENNRVSYAIVDGASSSSSAVTSTMQSQKKRKLKDSEMDVGFKGQTVYSTSIEELFQRMLSHFPRQDLLVSVPTLEFDFRIAVNPKSELLFAKNPQREIIPISGGKWSGTFGNGCVLFRSRLADMTLAERVVPDLSGSLNVLLSFKLLRTLPHLENSLEMHTRGSLSGPSDVLDIILSPKRIKDIDPRRYNFRMFCTVRAADNRYSELLNCGLWIASGNWKGEELIIDAFRVM